MLVFRRPIIRAVRRCEHSQVGTRSADPRSITMDNDSTGSAWPQFSVRALLAEVAFSVLLCGWIADHNALIRLHNEREHNLADSHFGARI